MTDHNYEFLRWCMLYSLAVCVWKTQQNCDILTGQVQMEDILGLDKRVSLHIFFFI